MEVRFVEPILSTLVAYTNIQIELAFNRTENPVCPTQRELESLFDRYDEDCSNTIDYKKLCDHIFEMGEHIAMNSAARSMIERVSIYTVPGWQRWGAPFCEPLLFSSFFECNEVTSVSVRLHPEPWNVNSNQTRLTIRPKQFKAQIFERGGVSGLRGLREHLESMDTDGSGLLQRSQLIQGLTNFGIDVDDGPGGDIEKIMGFFDRDVVGRIIIREFHRGLRVR